jgi:3-oxoacyl-[acyl-carrier-protein] synthase-1
MSTVDVRILQVGMITPVGIGVAQTAASVQAGLSRHQETSFVDRRLDQIVAAHLPEDALPPLLPKLGALPLSPLRRRLLRLATIPLQAAMEGIAEPVPLFLGVHEPLPQQTSPAADFVARLAEQAGVPLDLGQSAVFPVGRAAGMLALAEAVNLLQKGRVRQVLVGAVDSYFDAARLAALDVEDRLLGRTVSDGFIPGEGASFLLLGRDRGGATPLARITGVAVGQEAGHRYSKTPYKGEGLADTVTRLLDAHAGPPIATVYAGYNGESFWAKEWGVAYLRSRPKFSDPFAFLHPADCFGDPGAPLGLLMIGIGAANLQKGYVTGPCLVYSSSDREARGAAVMGAA